MSEKTPAQAIASASVARFNLALRRGHRLDQLRRKAERFDTPAWQRPFHRLRVRYFLFRHYRHVDSKGKT